MPGQDEKDYQDYLDYQEYQKHIGAPAPSAEPRKTGGIEGYLRGAADGMVPGNERLVAAQQAAWKSGDADAMNTTRNPMLDSPAENSALHDAVSASEGQPRDDLGIGGMAGRVHGAMTGLPALLGKSFSSLVPAAEKGGRMMKALSDIGKGVVGNTGALTAEKAMGEDTLPSSGELTTSAAIGGGVPLIGHALMNAKDGLSYAGKHLGGMAARMTPSQAETYSKDPALVKQLYSEYQDDPRALMERGRGLGKSAMDNASERISDLSESRNAARAGRTVQVNPEQFAGTDAEKELLRTAQADPRNWKMPSVSDVILDNAGNPINPAQPQFVPPSSMTIPAGRAGDLASDMGKNAGFGNQAFGVVQPEAKAAQEANRAGWSSMRSAVNGAVPGEAEANAAIAGQEKASATLGKTINTDSSKMLRDQSVKARALAQELSPEAYEAKKAFDAAMTFKPSDHDGLRSSLTKAGGRKLLEMVGPASSSAPRQSQSLQEVLAAIRAMQNGGAK